MITIACEMHWPWYVRYERAQRVLGAVLGRVLGGDAGQLAQEARRLGADARTPMKMES